MFHEFAHSYQSVSTPSLSFPSLQRRYPFLEKVSDDSVQETFAENRAYVHAFEAERDLLFRAASAPGDGNARALTCEGLGKLRERRAKYFAGSTLHWAQVEEVSLTTEGLGQWVAYAWLTRGRRIDAATVVRELRSPYWSQDQGLAIFLLADRLVPSWQKHVFASSPAGAEQLLAAACRR
jgi:hypothetical protein